jgi:hypothetical protein
LGTQDAEDAPARTDPAPRAGLTPEERFQAAGEDGRDLRPAPFWSWNDELDPEELRRQIREMKQAGLGGYFMHARIGLLTPYLGPRWMQCIKAAIDEGKAQGLSSWLYDEDKWPSGTCSNRIQSLGKEYQKKVVLLTESRRKDFRPASPAVATFVATKTGRRLVKPQRVPAVRAKTRASPRQTIFHFSVEYQPGYVDLLDPRVTDAFLQSTHQRYLEEVGSDFGQAIPGIFTDEPNIASGSPNGPALPWTESLLARFQERFGYDLRDHLLSLFYEVEDWRKARHDYWSLVTDLFVDAFSRRIGEWCDQHGLILTGHQLWEDDLVSQIRFCGAAMPHYEYMQMPGIDHLRRLITDPLLNKQVSSVAHQLRGRRVLSESYGAAGWDLSFQDQKWIAEWQYVMGVDFLCPHLALYSLKGCRKRDFPPSLFYQQPWWPHYRHLTDYLARLGSALTEGTHQADLLLLHPIASAWALFDPLKPTRVRNLNQQLASLAQALLEIHRDFDLGDETLLARHAAVEGDRLRVGAAAYSIVIIPPSLTLRAGTVELLARFLQGGGKLVFVKPAPTLVDALPSPRIAKELLRTAQAVPNRRGELRRLLNQLSPPRVVVLLRTGGLSQTPSLRGDAGDAASVYYQQRKLDDGRSLFFFANTDSSRTVPATVRLPGQGDVQEWNLLTGEITPLQAVLAEGCTSFELDFAPAGSHLVCFDPSRRSQARARPREQILVRQALADWWRIERSEPNVLTLDYCRYRADRGQWSRRLPTIRVNELLQQAGHPCDLELEFTFHSDLDLSRAAPCFLVMERPEVFSLSVNGQPLPRREDGWWCDLAFRKIELNQGLRQGENLLLLSGRFEPAPEGRGVEVESCYLLGEFDLRRPPSKGRTANLPDFLLTAPSFFATSGDLVARGLPFYRGAVTYRQTVQLSRHTYRRAFLELGEPRAAIASISVNGEPAGFAAWHPWRVEVTRLLKTGDNEIAITLYSTCRNLLGPHHHIHGELIAVGPLSFASSPAAFGQPARRRKTWTDDYSFLPFGLLGGASLAFSRPARS